MAAPVLRDIIAGRIHREGPISFEQFMQMALYYPERGYYTSPRTIIGRDGDFYTSSHLHPIFGALLGRQVEECRERLGCPDDFTIVEMGAGMGHFANDLLHSLKDKPFFSSLRYIIIEPNPYVATRQRELLKAFSDRVAWGVDLASLEPFRGCIVSNELLDAFPVRLVTMGDRLSEILVGVDGEGRFHEGTAECDDDIQGYFVMSGIQPETVMAAGYRTEVNLAVRNWLQSAAGRLIEGFVITIDYGYPAPDYYHPEHMTGTLLCYHRHQVSEDPYEHVGEQDITAHVNFSAVSRWGEGFGLRTLGYCNQGLYLAALGLDEVLSAHPVADYFEMARIKTLIMPGGMGDTHKVLIQYKGAGTPGLRGFSIRNDMRRL
jgi:SAM-dependent MidA family methyltransferase